MNRIYINDGRTSLSIECDDPIAYDIGYTVSVVAGEAFVAKCHEQFFVVGRDLHQNFLAFENYEKEEIRIDTNCDGFIDLARKTRGNIELSYRFKDFIFGDGCAISGKIEIDGDKAKMTLEYLRKVIFSKTSV